MVWEAQAAGRAVDFNSGSDFRIEWGDELKKFVASLPWHLWEVLVEYKHSHFSTKPSK